MKERTRGTRLLGILLVCLMMFVLVPTMALATGEENCANGTECTAHAAAIENVHYNTFAEAVENAKNDDKIVVLRNALIREGASNTPKDAIEIADGKTITIDLNGKTLTKDGSIGDWSEVRTSAFINKGTLTIEDSSTEKTGKIVGGGYNYCEGAVIKNYGTLNIISGRLESGAGTNGMDQSGHYVIFNLGDATISGGEFYSNSTRTALIRNDANMDITGGSFEQKDFLVLRNGDTSAEMNISGNTVVKQCDDRSIQANGTITIEGGTFNGDIQVPASGNLTVTTGTINGDLYGSTDGTGTINISADAEISSTTVQVLDSNNNFKGQYETLQAAFNNVATGDTVKLLEDVTLTQQVDIKKALNGLTFDGNNKKVTLQTTDDPSQSGGSGFYFGNVDESLWCTGIKIRDLTIEGKARFAIFLCGGKLSEITNVDISGEYYYAVNLYGTHGATFTDCNISNSLDLGYTNMGSAAVWSNVAADFPVKLVNSDLGIIGINTYGSDNTLAPKIFVDKDSRVTVHTRDKGEYSGNPRLCVSTTSEGNYVIKNFDNVKNEWVEVLHAAEIKGIKYDTLQAAINAADKGDTVTLLKDTTGYVEITKDLTLDLNGKTLNGVINTGGETQALKATAGKVTVKNGTIKGKVNAWDACEMTFAADVTIENTSLNGKSCFGISVWGAGTYGQSGCKTPKVVFNGKIRTIGKGSGIITNGSDKSKPIIIINESAEIISDGIGVYLPSGSLTVNGGKITGATAIYFKSTDLDIRGGVFTGTGEKTEYAYNGSGANATGDAVVIDNCNYPGGIDTVKISGGKFTSNNANAVGSYAGNGNTEALTGFISGGTFSSDPSEYCAAGYYMDASGNGDYPYTVKAGNKPNTAPIIVKDSANASVAEDVPTEHGVNTNAVQVDGVAEALENRKDELVKQSGVNTEDATKTEVAVRVDVKLTSVDTETKILTFTAKPVATVTVTKANGAPIVEKDVPVENSMLRGNITVQLPLPENFSPKQIKHTSEDGYVEYFINANEGAKRGAKTFKIEDGCAVFTITHFSTFELSGDITYVAPVYSGSGYDYYTITATVQGNGSVSPSGRIVLREDGTRTYTFTPDEGYAVSDVKVDGKSIGAVNSYTFEDIDRDHTIEVSFVKLSAPAAAPAEPSAPESSTAPEAPEAPEVSEAPEASAPENSEAEEPSVPADTKPAERGSFPALPVVGAVVALLAIVLLLIRKKK